MSRFSQKMNTSSKE